MAIAFIPDLEFSTPTFSLSCEKNNQREKSEFRKRKKKKLYREIPTWNMIGKRMLGTLQTVTRMLASETSQ